MDRITGLMDMLDYIMETKRKRHVIGGLLLSVSMFFGGIAITVMTVKDKEDSYE